MPLLDIKISIIKELLYAWDRLRKTDYLQNNNLQFM